MKVTKGTWNKYETYILKSKQLEVTLLPKLGNNVIGIRDLQENREILRRPEESELDFYLQKPYHFGMPMLMPPGRIRRGHFEYDGVEYQFDQNTANDNHIHGLHRTQPWRISDIDENDAGCQIVTELLTADDPNWIRQYPTPLKLEMTLQLQGTSLMQRLKITNLGEHSAPFGFGLHTWFLLDGEPERWTLKIPVSDQLLQDEEQIPTGEVVPLDEWEELNTGMNMANRNWDNLLRIGDKRPVSAELKRDDGYGLRYSADPDYFKYWVLYTKGESDQFLCIEPYTSLPDAPNSSHPPQFTGLIELHPGEPVELSLQLDVVEKSTML
ncbi:aldose epimerase family protein [Paenibacillus sp. Z6-24]